MPTFGDYEASDLEFPTVTTPVRTLNTVFTPHATRPVLGLYTVSVGGTTTLLSGDDGRIRLRSDLGVPVTIRASMRNRVFATIGVTVGHNSVVETELVFLIPAGWSVDLSTEVLVAAPVFTLIRSTEIIL